MRVHTCHATNTSGRRAQNQIQNHAIVVTTNHTCSEIHAEKQIRAGRQTHAVTPIHKTETHTHTQNRNTHTLKLDTGTHKTETRTNKTERVIIESHHPISYYIDSPFLRFAASVSAASAASWASFSRRSKSAISLDFS